MKKVLIPVILFTLALNLFPVMVRADTADECDRVGALIDNAAAMINRAEPVIQRSGNRQAIAMLNEAVNNLHAAQRAYNNDMCRAAYNHAQTAMNLVRGALRLVNRPNSL